MPVMTDPTADVHEPVSGYPESRHLSVNHQSSNFAPRPCVIDFIASLWDASVAKQNGRKKNHV